MSTAKFVPGLKVKDWVAIEKVTHDCVHVAHVLLHRSLNCMKPVALKGSLHALQNETVIQAELVSRGPLSVAINAEMLQFYHSGVWDTILHCNPTSLDHGNTIYLINRFVCVCSDW